MHLQAGLAMTDLLYGSLISLLELVSYSGHTLVSVMGMTQYDKQTSHMVGDISARSAEDLGL